ncbi:MAG: sulfatase-like hydrolase/transferase [Spirochaetia bacterium]|jgi:arylsulfatase A-like enzyme|nr:sulfatase-like hydrolase/transferase [Spirochaetia bacterium]
MRTTNDREHGKKNVLLVTVDHWPGSLLGCAGRGDILSPSIDALSRCGVRFSNAYSATPVCIPARRELMTGTCAKTHGDRGFNEFQEMPAGLPTLPQVFRDNGYQAYAVGKLHVYPQRARIGFDDVLLNEESRRVNYPHEMREDDYARFMAREGYSGLNDAHGMSNNDYITRPWHLPEHLHQTSWTARQMCETIIRRDPGRPAFWYCGFTAPHPPLVPPKTFLDKYGDAEIAMPETGEWAKNFEDLPYCLKYYSSIFNIKTEKPIRDALKAFFALCTHIDFSLRLVIGTLREEKALDNTIIAITCDHGDMLGTHGLWAKNVFYENSSKVPFIIIPAESDKRLKPGSVDERLVELRDMMPTLLDLADIPIPKTVEGMSLLDSRRRDYIYGELWEDDRATRMIRTEKFKLIYYAVGNRLQLFDMTHDPAENHDLSGDPAHAKTLAELTGILVSRLYGADRSWLRDGKLVGLEDKEFAFKPSQENVGILKNRELLIQRGIR